MFLFEENIIKEEPRFFWKSLIKKLIWFQIELISIVIVKMKVNIWKLPQRSSERGLERRLEDYGRLISFRFYGSYAIVEFRHSRDAERAIRKMNDSYYDGVRIRVDECNTKFLWFYNLSLNNLCFN